MANKIFSYLADAKKVALGTKNEVYKLDDGFYYVGTYDSALKVNAKRGKFKKIKK
jgi:hypothetical protein